jgi:hypothetical protein
MRVGSVSFRADGFLSNDGFAPSLPLSGDSVLFFRASCAYKLSLTKTLYSEIPICRTFEVRRELRWRGMCGSEHIP